MGHALKFWKSLIPSLLHATGSIDQHALQRRGTTGPWSPTKQAMVTLDQIGHRRNELQVERNE